MKWIALSVFGGFGLLATIAGLVWGLKRWELLRSGVRTQGVVVEQFKSVSTSVEDDKTRSGPSISYYPVVEYRTAAGSIVRFRGATGGGVPEYDLGAAVTVVYQPNNPQRATILSFSQVVLGPLVATIAGLSIIAMGVGTFFVIRESDRNTEAVRESVHQQLPR